MVFKIARKHLCIPYVLFLLLFVIAPVIVILYYAFTNGEGQFTVASSPQAIRWEHFCTVYL